MYARLTLPPIAGGTGAEAALIVGAVAAVAGTAVATTGVIMQAQQQKKAYQYQGAVADQQVELAERAGAAAEADTRERARRVMAAQRNALGEGGITQEGTPLLVLMDTAQQAELDALRARYSGQVAAHGPSIEADLARQRAGYTDTARNFGVGSTLLTGATNVAGIYASGRRRSPNSPTTTTPSSGNGTWGDYM